MRLIRQALLKRWPDAAVRLADTLECQLADIDADTETQRYCRQHGIDGMELSIHRDDKARELIGPDRYQLDARFAGGTCNPCIYTIEEGLGERVPPSGRLRYHLRILPRVRHWLARHPDLYMRVRALSRRLRSSSVAPPRACAT